ncbi:unnamed protein product, partial [Amoebophrya sp. A120]|eukprot:GSA120T00012528001.1
MPRLVAVLPVVMFSICRLSLVLATPPGGSRIRAASAPGTASNKWHGTRHPRSRSTPRSSAGEYEKFLQSLSEQELNVEFINVVFSLSGEGEEGDRSERNRGGTTTFLDGLSVDDLLGPTLAAKRQEIEAAGRKVSSSFPGFDVPAKHDSPLFQRVFHAFLKNEDLQTGASTAAGTRAQRDDVLKRAALFGEFKERTKSGPYEGTKLFKFWTEFIATRLAPRMDAKNWSNGYITFPDPLHRIRRNWD